MPERPNMIVTFYDNYRLESRNIAGVSVGTFDNGTEQRTYNIHEKVAEAVEDGEGHTSFPVIEESDYTEELAAEYISFPITCVGVSGGYHLTIEHFNGTTYHIGFIPFNATAAEARALLDAAGLEDPGNPSFERFRIIGGGTTVEEAGPWFATVHEVEAGKLQFRLFAHGGISREGGESIHVEGEGLGEVIEHFHEWDETSYTVPLERNTNCG